MKLLLFSVVPSSASTRLLMDAAVRRGHQVVWRNPLELGVFLHPGHARLTGEQTFDVALTRMGGGTPAQAFHLLHALDAAGLPAVNRPAALAQTYDKLRQLTALVANGVPVPETACVRPAELEQALLGIPGPPWILKTLEGHKGQGVMRVDSRASLRSAADLLDGLGQRFLLQRYVQEAAGADVRILVIGGEARAAMRRQAHGDEFRSNLHRGGNAEPIALTPALASVAQQAAAALGLDVAGVDILLAKDGPLVIEVNGSPGLEGITRSTGQDLAAAVITLLEQRALAAPATTVGD